jgi:hypothetical protein
VANAAGEYASAPQNVTATPIELGIRVDWSPPAYSSPVVSGYKVEYSLNGTTGWTTAATTGSGVTSYSITGLSVSATYVRVAALMVSNTVIGTYGYPWTEVYRTTSSKNNSGNASIDYVGGFGLASNDAASNLNNTADFSRVKYHFEANLGSGLDFADTDFYKWSGASITTLQVPVIGGTSSTFVVQTNVTDLNTYSNHSRVTDGAGLTGRLEIWPWNYAPSLSSDYAYGDAVRYDYNDSSNGNGAYGSFQVHDLTNTKNVFSWNYHSYDQGLTNPDIGFGNNPTNYSDPGTGTYSMPDWTFCHENNTYRGYCASPTAFKLQIFINLASTPLPDSTPPSVTRVDAKQYAKNGDTITVSSNELGTVYLVKNSVSVSNLASITNAASNQKNSVSISTSNSNTTLTTSGLQDGKYNLYSVDGSGNVSAAIANTITMDSTPPTVTSIYLNTSGLTVFMNMNETVTHTSMGDTLYTISDGGPTNNVGSTGGSAMQLQISVYRAIPAGATVNFAYTPSAGAASGRWVDLAGNELAAIALAPITNNSTVGISVSLTAPTTMYKGVAVNISTSVNYPGKVTFLDQGKRIAGCIGKVATGTPPITVTCSYKARARGNTALSAIYTPSNSSIAGGVTPIQNRFILNRSNTR